MTRFCSRRARRWNLLPLAIALQWFAVALVAHSQTPNLHRPNIIVITSDDSGYNEFGFSSALNGQTTPFETPRLDELAQRSVVLSQGYIAGHSVCATSRAALLTGVHPQRFGYEDNISRGTAGQIDGIPAGQTTIASQLKGLGYATGAIGKWHVGTQDNVNRPQDLGFDEFYGFLGGDRSFFKYSGSGSFDSGLRRGDTLIETSWASQGDPSLHDPVRGRYLTDAFGEEAVDFIERRGEGDDPFFLYVAFNATHTPFEVKQQDYERFAHITDDTQRHLAAMAYALDRSIGSIVDAVEANGLAEETIIVYANDNGGRYPYNSNTPFWGHKGSMFEGGIRVPFLMHVPGIEGTVYDRPVSTLDLLPTFTALAGGEVEELVTDGVDVLPFLSGEIEGDPHEALFWRGPSGRFAVRKGDWKLVRPDHNPFARLHNIEWDRSERSYVNSQYPAIVADLVHELTVWEAGLQKAKWGPLGVRNKNEFDHFVYDHGQGTNGIWSAVGAWHKGGTATAVQMSPEDAYANAILEFRTSGADYTATNDMLRATRYTFMANEIRLTGESNGAAGRQATINGNAVLMVKNLEGKLPSLSLSASGQPGSFAFRIENDLHLMDDLEINGNGSQAFVIAGSIQDFFVPNQTAPKVAHSVVKSGESSVTLTGSNTFGGTLNLTGGKVRLDGSNAAIIGAAGIVIGPDATFELSTGLVAVQAVNNSAGGEFDFHGGTLQAFSILGDLVNDGGTFAPGTSAAISTITGDFIQNEGTLEMQIGGTMPGAEHDKLLVDGTTNLDGRLRVTLINGFTPSLGQKFELLAAEDGVFGQFDSLMLPPLDGNLHWSLQVANSALSLIIGLPGDYNEDGTVDAADYSVWRDSKGNAVPVGTGADGNRDGQVNDLDYALWKSNFGARAISGSGSSLSPVPEPATSISILIATCLVCLRRRPR